METTGREQEGLEVGVLSLLTTSTSPPIDCSFTSPFAQQGEEDSATRLSPTWHLLGTGQISVEYSYKAIIGPQRLDCQTC